MSRNEKDEKIFSIGATAREVGVTPHVLRKWQSRYGVVQPLRGNNGRRMYSSEQIVRLRMVKSLMESGVELKELAAKSTEELSRLSEHRLKRRETLVRVFGSPFIEGDQPVLPSSMSLSLHFEEKTWAEAHPEPADLLVLDVPNIDNLMARRLRAFRDAVSAPVLVVYRYAHPSLLAMLRSADIKAHRGPVSIWLVEDLMIARQPEVRLKESQLGPVERRRYTESMVMKVGNAADAVECECPKNIANILTDLYAFENYSLECVVSQPDDGEIHQYLHQVTANARALFENALGRLADYEGIEIK